MKEIELAIGASKYKLTCEEEEIEKIKTLSIDLNKQINLLAMQIGRLNNLILFIILALRNSDKINQIKHASSASFENSLIASLKNFTSLIQNNNDKEIEDKLLLCNLVLANELIILNEQSTKIIISDNSSQENKQNLIKENSLKFYKEHTKELEDILNKCFLIKEKFN